MNTTTTIKLESPYKDKPFQIGMNILLAIFLGPFIIFMMVHTAIMNKVDDPLSWALLCISSLLFVFLSYSKFKYIHFILYGKPTAEISYQNRSILFMPHKETVWIDQIDTFIYSNRFKKYILRNKNIPGTSVEVKRNTEFEHALMKFSLECKVE